MRVLSADRPAPDGNLRPVEIDGEFLAGQSVVPFRPADDEIAHAVQDEILQRQVGDPREPPRLQLRQRIAHDR